jgi:voltage-gated potassium channel
MEQVEVPEDSPLSGKSLVDAGIRQKFGVIIVAIKRGAGTMEFNPSPEALIRSGDQLVVLGQLSSVKALEETIQA